MQSAKRYAAGMNEMGPKETDPYELTKRTAGGFSDDLASWQADAPRRRIGDGAGNDAMREALAALQAVTGKATSAITATETLAANDQIPVEGKRRVMREHIEAMPQQIQAQADRARIQATQAAAEFTQAALGKVPKADQMAARADLQMFLQDVPADQRPARIAELAGRDDHVGWLAASETGRMAMEASGADPRTIRDMHAKATRAALAAARKSSDEDRRTAAAYVDHLDKLTGTIDWAHSVARVAGSELRRRHGFTQLPG